MTEKHELFVHFVDRNDLKIEFSVNAARYIQNIVIHRDLEVITVVDEMTCFGTTPDVNTMPWDLFLKFSLRKVVCFVPESWFCWPIFLSRMHFLKWSQFTQNIVKYTFTFQIISAQCSKYFNDNTKWHQTGTEISITNLLYTNTMRY